MLNLQHFKGKDIQNFITIINSYENIGITDIRFVRTKLQEYVEKVMFRDNISKRREKRKKLHTQNTPVPYVVTSCPSCDRGKLEPLFIEGELILSCKKCRYSKLMEDKDVK